MLQTSLQMEPCRLQVKDATIRVIELMSHVLSTYDRAISDYTARIFKAGRAWAFALFCSSQLLHWQPLEPINSLQSAHLICAACWHRACAELTRAKCGPCLCHGASLLSSTRSLWLGRCVCGGGAQVRGLSALATVLQSSPPMAPWGFNHSAICSGGGQGGHRYRRPLWRLRLGYWHCYAPAGQAAAGERAAGTGLLSVQTAVPA